MIRIILSLLICSPILSAAEIPTLKFDDKISWKQIFNFGFRPKHLEGLERNTCVSQNQSFWLQFKNRESKFKLERGSIDFTFLYDDFLTLIWHQGAEPITLEEGKRRSDEFRKLFNGYIVQEISMPNLIDPSGLVDAGNDENNVKARVGEYLIWYGFDNSLGKEKPIIPHFYIAWSFPGRPDMRGKDSGDVVRPPKGYEWYSLDPKVNTPDPGTTPDKLPAPETKDLIETPKEAAEKPNTDSSKISDSPDEPKSSFLRWMVGGFVLLAILLLFKTWKGKSER